MALERRRGITIKTAVASFPVGGVTVNLIDTPGHPDFIAEVDRALRVLDGAVLVVSAVEGVQAQTRVLMRTLRRRQVPTLLFVNKIDRAGARPAQVLRDLATKLTPDILAMSTVDAPGTPGATSRPAGGPDFTARMVESAGDDDLLAAYLDDEHSVPYRKLREALARRARTARLHPVFFGSAMTGAGVDALTAALVELLPAAAGQPDRPLSGTVFKVERDHRGARTAYVRLFDGTLTVRDHVPVNDAGVSVITALEDGNGNRRTSVAAGEIAKVHGLRDVRIGDTLGTAPAAPAPAALFAPPTLESVVVPVRAGDGRALHTALTELA